MGSPSSVDQTTDPTSISMRISPWPRRSGTTGRRPSSSSGMPTAVNFGSLISAETATPTSGNEYKVVNWVRAAAIIAEIDPVKQGYLRRDSAQRLRLPAVRQLGSVDLN